ncbi:MAG TPA: DNA gyrase inhibitor YacG [Xanthobacteraceae bacterium]|nr:DNA gyrase inhibitor YacG [Xanthobacteraceae bacterium]
MPAARNRGGKPCPICGRPAAEAFRPFCSKRCADIDLNRWLSGVYAVAAAESDDEEAPPERGGEA